jgi:citrate synthase
MSVKVDSINVMSQLTTQQVADRLGVKVETIYAYVSRGLLSGKPAPVGRGSVFDAKDVEALLRSGRRARQQIPTDPASSAHPLAVDTSITLIERDRLYFRGVDALELASRHTYEEVADWLWTGVLIPGTSFHAPQDSASAARAAVSALPSHSGPVHHLRAAVVAASATDPLRFALDDETLIHTARSLIATMAGALAAEPASEGGVAATIFAGLASADADQQLARVLGTAMAVLVDHDLAASTMAARVAAAARANIYAVVSAALGAVEGALHGGASANAHRMLVDVMERGAATPVVSELTREGRRIPGLGHRIYPREDPRATLVFELLGQVPAAEAAVNAATEVVAAVARSGRELMPNIDMALAALAVSAQMPSESGEAVFAIARTAGWVAHAMEEYSERPLRIRPSGRYVGPRPPQPLP